MRKVVWLLAVFLVLFLVYLTDTNISQDDFTFNNNNSIHSGFSNRSVGDEKFITPAGTFLVSRVIDGDTIELLDGQRVRYLGIDSPEIDWKEGQDDCFAKQAYLQNQKLVLGKMVRLEKDKSDQDKYGRLLRYVYIDGILVNEYLLRYGYARLQVIPPDDKFVSQFSKAASAAQRENLGLWKACR